MGNIPSNLKPNQKPSSFLLTFTNMPVLLDLPDEILRMFANQAGHGDIVNLALSSRRMLALSNNALQRHNNNRDAYLPIRFGDVQQSPYPLRNPLHVIREIIRDAEVAFYPIEIIIGDFTALDNTSHITNNANTGRLNQILPRCGPQILALVNSNDYIDHRAMWASVLAKEHGPATAMLLTLLPDLRSIEFRDLSMSGAAVLSTVQKIVERTRTEPNRTHPLSKLAVVSLRGWSDDYEEWAKLEIFVELRSLRSIRCQYVRGNINAVRGNPEPRIDDPERLSDMTTLDLRKCALEQSDLFPVFESIRALQTFNYEYARPEQPPNARTDPLRDLRAGKWEPRKIVQSLLARFSGSLVNLDMTTANTEVRHGSFNAGQIFVGDLRNFRLLRQLKADTLLFIESSLGNYIVKARGEFETALHQEIGKRNYHFALSHEEHMELVDRHTFYAINTDDRVHQLEGLLPESLQELTLCVTLSGGSSIIEPMFNGLPGRLSRLRKMTFEGVNPLKAAKEAALARAGIQIL